MIFVKYKNKYRKYHPVFGNTHAGLVFHTHVWFLPNVWKSLRYLVKTTHVRFLPNTFWGWRAVTSNVWLRLGKETDVWGNDSWCFFYQVFRRLWRCLCRWYCSITLSGEFLCFESTEVNHAIAGLVLMQLKLTCSSKKWKFFQMIELTRNGKKN